MWAVLCFGDKINVTCLGRVWVMCGSCQSLTPTTIKFTIQHRAALLPKLTLKCNACRAQWRRKELYCFCLFACLKKIDSLAVASVRLVLAC